MLIDLNETRHNRQIFEFIVKVTRSTKKIILVGDNIPVRQILSFRKLGYHHLIIVNPEGNSYTKIPLFERTPDNFINYIKPNFSSVKYETCANITNDDISTIIDFNGTRLKLCHRENCSWCRQGMEIKIFRTVFDHLNISIEFLVFNRNNSRLCDIIYGHSVPHGSVSLKFTIPFVYETLSWYVSVKPINRIVFLFRIVSTENWIMIAITTAILAIVTFLMYHLMLKDSHTEHPTRIHFLSFYIFMEQSRRLTLEIATEWLLAILAIYFGFILNAIYKSRIIHFLTNKEFGNSATSYDDLVYRNEKMAFPEVDIPPGFVDGFSSSHLIFCGNSLKCLKRCAFGGEFAVLALDRTARRFWNDLNPQGNRNLKKLTPVFHNLMYVAYMNAGHPFLPVFNEYLQKLIEFGFMKRIIFEYDAFYNIRDITSENKPLTMWHMAAPLAILSTGLLLSVFTFFLEKSFSNISL
ncbi:hypothetical protein WA026_016342 [Henosepilachna vigintioctopunctata]|uniref:Ionotropic receptor n=1 Tax=Henosepilachna vigintioctopunctata TaxID=420089 RepID=A0AAW1UCV1_9CUCU